MGKILNNKQIGYPIIKFIEKDYPLIIRCKINKYNYKINFY